jgi:hypothetical protein
MVSAGFDEDPHAQTVLSGCARGRLSFDCANADQHREKLVFDVELGVGQVLAGKSGQESDRGQHISEGANLDASPLEDAAEEPTA